MPNDGTTDLLNLDPGAGAGGANTDNGNGGAAGDGGNAGGNSGNPPTDKTDFGKNWKTKSNPYLVLLPYRNNPAPMHLVYYYHVYPGRYNMALGSLFPLP